VRAIFTYHSIDSSGSAISVSEDVFRRHIRWLASGAVKVLPLDVLVAWNDDTDAVALSFDDGFLNFAAIAAPLLEEYRLPATLFVATSHVGSTNAWHSPRENRNLPTLGLLDWDGIAAVSERGISIGSHGKTHRPLTSLSATELNDELAGSFEDMRRHLGSSPGFFAYPFGAATLRERNEAAQIYALAVTTEMRDIAKDEDLHMLPRVDAWYFRTQGRLESFGTPAFNRYLHVRSRGRRLRASVNRLLGQDGG
jgi:peptidoglycan/xylan/chitin deacetylase (PgdA/CDA1 family)